MGSSRLRNDLMAVAVALAVITLGLGVRFLLVHVPPGFDAPAMCQRHTDFWNGDQFLCEVTF